MPKVLVVDDSEIDRCLVGSILKTSPGWEVGYAVDGNDALAQFLASPFDVVVTDMQMPNMSGLTLVTAIKKDFPTTPVILMTGSGSEEIAAEALRLGAASYVPKKNIAEDLVEILERVFAAASDDRQHLRLMHHMTADDANFDLPSDWNLLHALVAHLQNNLRCLPLGDETERLRVTMAVSEALMNAYYHGSLEVGTAAGWPARVAINQIVTERLRLEPYCDRRIHVHTHIRRSQAVFVIRDEGPGFDWRKLSEPDSLSGTEQSGGRGIVLMRAIMDEVCFNDKGNEVRLTKHSWTGEHDNLSIDSDE